MKILKCTLALATSLLLAAPSQAAFVSSKHADFGLNTVTYDTVTRMGWLDFTTTRGRSYNQVKTWLETDAKYTGFRFATVAETHEMVSRLFPSIYTASVHYSGEIGAPIVNTTESGLFRELFINNRGDYAYGLIYDAPRTSFQWVGSNPWGAGQVAYTNTYNYQNGIALSNPNANPFGPDWGWFLVADGNVSLNGDFSLKVAEVSSPLTLGALLMPFMVFAASRRRKASK